MCWGNVQQEVYAELVLALNRLIRGYGTAAAASQMTLLNLPVAPSCSSQVSRQTHPSSPRGIHPSVPTGDRCRFSPPGPPLASSKDSFMTPSLPLSFFSR